MNPNPQSIFLLSRDVADDSAVVASVAVAGASDADAGAGAADAVSGAADAVAELPYLEPLVIFVRPISLYRPK